MEIGFYTLITQCFYAVAFFSSSHQNCLFVLVFIVFAHNMYVQHVNAIHEQKLNRIPNES